MKNASLTVGAPSEKENPTSETPAKVVVMETEAKTVSQMLNKASGFIKNTKDLETLYAMRERFNILFFGTGEESPKEIKYVALVPVGGGSTSYRNEEESFKVIYPETVLKIRALVNVDLGQRIEELEKQIVGFKI